MRKFKLSLTSFAFVLGVGLAVITGFSSFTKTSKKSGTIFYYTLNSASEYTYAGESAPSDDGCQGSASYNCIVGLSTYKGTTTSASGIGTPVYTSGGLALYNDGE